MVSGLMCTVTILAHPEDPDISAIPMYASDYIREYFHIRKEQEQHMVQPKNFSPLKQRFLSCNKRLNHFPKKDMFKLFDQGILPSRFAQLKADSLLFVSCIYGKNHRKSWRTHGKKLAFRRYTNNTPCEGTSTYPLVSGQPGLIAQIGGHLTGARIWAFNVFVDNCSNLVYNHLIQSMTKEETLNAKTAYERFSDDHGIKACLYHANNGWYDKKLSGNRWRVRTRLSPTAASVRITKKELHKGAFKIWRWMHVPCYLPPSFIGQRLS